ncbi:terminase small subunit [uncultured Parvimonas sp.]|uniref:terminase small subunit n=1 Tax=uncultured Parvimonas sp. TaxID=747372 RepID=UPI002593F78C|nr:terminase small subunit [uncultured Parvimonas sp.]
MEKLTLKQQRFADEYIISGNIYQSLIYAGYSKNYAKSDGCKILDNPRVKNYIDERLKELEDKAIAKQEEVLKYLTSVVRGESRSVVVVVEGEGDGVSSARLVNKPPDEKEKLKAAELLGKRYKLFTDKVELDADVDMDLNVKVDYGD